MEDVLDDELDDEEEEDVLYFSGATVDPSLEFCLVGGPDATSSLANMQSRNAAQGSATKRRRLLADVTYLHAQ